MWSLTAHYWQMSFWWFFLCSLGKDFIEAAARYNFICCFQALNTDFLTYLLTYTSFSLICTCLCLICLDVCPIANLFFFVSVFQSSSWLRQNSLYILYFVYCVLIQICDVGTVVTVSDMSVRLLQVHFVYLYLCVVTCIRLHTLVMTTTSLSSAVPCRWRKVTRSFLLHACWRTSSWWTRWTAYLLSCIVRYCSECFDTELMKDLPLPEGNNIGLVMFVWDIREIIRTILCFIVLYVEHLQCATFAA